MRSQQEQKLGTLDTRIDAMMEKRTQAIMDRLDGLLVNRSESRNKGAYPREAFREPTSTSIQTEEELMGSREKGVTNTAAPLGVIGLEIPRRSEKALLAVHQSRTKDLHEKRGRVEEVIPQTGITRTREELSQATRTGGKFRSLKQQI